MSFIAELKRRNVVKVGIAYLVGAWLLLQLTEVLSELLTLPASIGPIVVGAVLVGLPITLVTAWLYELTPDGFKPERAVDRSQSTTTQTGRKLNALIFVLMALALGYFIWESRFADRTEAVGTMAVQGEAGTRHSAPTVERQSIAVLPFANRSRREEDEFFVEGIHDDLLTNLAKIGSMKVISRTSVNRYLETEKSIPEIASELGVATIMEGAVQRAGDTVRINVQLIDAQTDEHLWAEIFDRELTTENLFDIQTEISEMIATALEATLSTEEKQRISRRPTDSLEAYNAYLRGLQLMPRRTADDLEAARKQFEQAVELDPDFAQAWASLALSALLEANYGAASFREAQGIMTSASERALELNPELAGPWLIRASLKQFMGHYTEAEADFLKALELEPNNAMAHHWYANYLDDSSARLDEAHVHALRATELDPLSSIDQLELGDIYQKLGQFEEAERHYQHVLDRDPEFSTAFQYMGLLKEETGHFDEMIYWLRQSQRHNPGNPRLLLDEAWAWMSLDDAESMKALRQRIESAAPDHPMLGAFDAFVAFYDGRTAAALENLQAMKRQLGGAPFVNAIMGIIHLVEGNLPEARAAIEQSDSRLWDRTTWEAAYKGSTSRACLVAWLMTQTGDEDLGRELMGNVIRYYEDELPNYLQHPERYDASVCYLSTGQAERAVDITETWLNNGFWFGWWQWRLNPLNRPLLESPRVQDAMARMHEELARQRENVRRMAAEGKL